jgi:hypothetical protein
MRFLYTILLLALISVQANAQGLVSGVVKSASDGSTIPVLRSIKGIQRGQLLTFPVLIQ